MVVGQPLQEGAALGRQRRRHGAAAAAAARRWPRAAGRSIGRQSVPRRARRPARAPARRPARRAAVGSTSRSTSTCIHDSRVACASGSSARSSCSACSRPCASRCTTSTGCTIRCSDRPWRLISMVVRVHQEGHVVVDHLDHRVARGPALLGQRRADDAQPRRCPGCARRRTARPTAARRAGPRACARPGRRRPGGGSRRGRRPRSAARSAACRRGAASASTASMRSRRAVSIDGFIGLSPSPAAWRLAAPSADAPQLTPAPAARARATIALR